MSRLVYPNKAPSAEALSSRRDFAELQQILKSAPQDLWLETLRRASGPRHDALIYWMLNQTQCDFTVAASAFFRCQPIEHLEDPQPLPLVPAEHNHFALILLNWDKGYYRTHSLEVTDVDRPPRALAVLNQKMIAWPRGSLPFRIPRELLMQTGGRPLKVPEHLSPDTNREMWHLFSKLGLSVTGKPPRPGRIGKTAMRLRTKLRLGRTRSQR